MPKTCSCGCGRPVFSKGLSKSCWGREHGKPLKRSTKPIAPVGKKLAKERKLYNEERAEYLQEGDLCELRVNENCQNMATQIHHPAGRMGAKLRDKTNQMKSCQYCNDWVESHHAQAVEMGLKKSRLKKE